MVLDAFSYLGTTNTRAISWGIGQDEEITDYLARKIVVLAGAGSETTGFLSTLTTYQNSDGGFGGYKDWTSGILDTSLALSALKSANYSESTVIEPGLWYLVSNQNPDGGWGLTEEAGSNVYLTSLVLLTLNQYRKDYYLEEAINKATTWLMTQTGESLWEKAIAYSANAECGIQNAELLEYILANQQANGSWDNDPFTTALALRAIKDSAPDLIVSNIFFDPQVPIEGDTVTVTAVVENIGGSKAENIEVAVSNQLSAISEIGAGGSATVSYTGTFSAGIHKIRVEIDPENKIEERNETNNIAEKNLTIATIPDLIPHISFNPQYPPIDGTTTIIATVYNQGETKAENLLISLYEESTHLTDFTLNIPGGENRKAELIYGPFPTGSYTFYCIVDPSNAIVESNETNNTGSSTLFVGTPIYPSPPDLVITDLFISPEPLTDSTPATITVTIKNIRGTPVESVELRVMSDELEIKEIISLNAYSSLIFSYSSLYLLSGTHTIYAIIDPEDKIIETNETNNQTQTTIFVQNVPPSVPTGLMAYPGDGIVDLIWNPNSEPDLTGYNIYRDGINLETITTTNFRDTGLTNGIEYTYWITAVDDDSLKSDLSVSVTATPESGYINPPIITKPTVYGKTLWTNIATQTISGTATSNLIVKLFLNGISFGTTTSSLSGTFTFTPVFLSEGTNTITAVAIEGTNLSKPSLPITIILDTIPPSAPTGLSATHGDEVIYLVWNPNPEPDVVGYNVYRDGVRINTEVIMNTLYEDTGLINGATYTYTITAQDRAGNEGEESEEVKAIPEVPTKIINVGVMVCESAGWENPDGTIFYGLETSSLKPKGWSFLNPWAPEGYSKSHIKYWEINLSNVTLEELLRYDVVFLTNHTTTMFTEADNEKLKEFIESGGKLWIDDCLGMRVYNFFLNFQFNSWQWAEPKVAVIPDHPLLNYIYVLTPSDIYWLGQHQNGGWVNGFDSEIFEVVTKTGNSNNADVIVTQYGKGWIIVSGNDYGCAINDYNNSEDIKWAYNLCGWLADIPDLTISNMAFSNDSPIEGEEILISAYIHNVGKDKASNILIKCFDGDPKEGLLIGSQTISVVKASSTYLFIINWRATPAGSHTIYVIADPEDIIEEENETNNIGSATIFVYGITPKLDLAPTDITITPATPTEGRPATITAKIANQGNQEARNVKVEFWDGSPGEAVSHQVSTISIPEILAEGTQTISVTWETLGQLGRNYIYVVVDPDNSIEESNENNNISHKACDVISPDKPDLAVENLQLNPYSLQLTEGDTATITAIIKNYGASAEGIEIVIGHQSLVIGSQTIIGIPLGGTETINFVWDTLKSTGPHTITLTVDPDDAIDELDEENNSASIDCFVNSAELGLEISTDKPAYTAYETVTATVVITNLGTQARTVDLGVGILDSHWQIPAITLGPNERATQTILWNTGNTLAGTYSIEASLKENSKFEIRNSKFFEILPVIEIESSVVTDKIEYSANKDVTILSKVKSQSSNFIFPTLTVSIQITTGQLPITDHRLPITNLLPNALWQGKSYWNTGTNTPEEYTITQTILYGTQSISMATCTLAIVSDLAGIFGDIQVMPKEVKTYGSLTFDYQVNNTRNTDLINLPLNILIIDPDTGELKQTLTDIATITSGASYTSTKVWDSVDLKEPRVYLAILQAGTKSLDSDTFKVLPYGWAYGQVEGYAYSRALDFAIYTEKEQVYLGGGGKPYTFVLGGSVHSNTKAVINNKKHKIVGPSYLNDSPVIGITPGQTNPDYLGDIPFPTIDLEYYRQIAKEQNRYYTSLYGVSLPQGKDQVTLVELSKGGGELRFSGNNHGEGTLILLSQDNINLKFSGTVDFKGLIYTNGQIELSGNVQIEGCIIAKSAVLNGTPRVSYNLVNLWQNRIPITDALISARDETTGKTQTTTTTSSGTYTLSYLPAGTYTMIAQKEGYISSSTGGVIIRVNQGTEVNFVVIQERLTRLLTAPLSQIDEEGIIPLASQLLPSFPNPANDGCYIPFKLAVSSEQLAVEIYNILGQKVRTIEVGERKAGSYTQKDRAIFWDMKNDQGQKASSGLYFINLKAGEFSAIKSLVITR
ncbi:MAG: CARDB domain-containing protein [Candidatus Desantisbacteria bacterium]